MRSASPDALFVVSFVWYVATASHNASRTVDFLHGLPAEDRLQGAIQMSWGVLQVAVDVAQRVGVERVRASRVVQRVANVTEKLFGLPFILLLPFCPSVTSDHDDDADNPKQPAYVHI